MVSRFQVVVTVLLAVLMLAILVSPAVASAPTTLRGRACVAPLALSLTLPLAAPVHAMMWQRLHSLRAISHAPDVVDLTSARLC
jgi:hypothetical protein